MSDNLKVQGCNQGYKIQRYEMILGRGTYSIIGSKFIISVTTVNVSWGSVLHS